MWLSRKVQGQGSIGVLGRHDSRWEQYELSRAALRDEIVGWLTTVQDMADNLPEVDDPEATKEFFGLYKNTLKELATLLVRYTEKKGKPYYQVFLRSTGTLEEAQTVIRWAREIAVLFERYRRDPALYQESGSRVDLEYLLVSLDNLREYLNA